MRGAAKSEPRGEPALTVLRAEALPEASGGVLSPPPGLRQRRDLNRSDGPDEEPQPTPAYFAHAQRRESATHLVGSLPGAWLGLLLLHSLDSGCC